eukprot:TRINITY_DN8592_c0_g1_i2.p1 TRINITY_DN8592_c0_g1~~TRINITY_DN8592_c0_g1_i2.p1  ORF type:complete len:116 (-),score=30.82 TRINITY_DN8592_c0_g1_i2:208-555(-)
MALLYARVKDESDLMVCAAYGDLQAISDYSGEAGQYDVNALMVAVANGQVKSAALLHHKFPHLVDKRCEHGCEWRHATHQQRDNPVYLPRVILRVLSSQIDVLIFVASLLFRRNV